jgi:hypothetical protein
MGIGETIFGEAMDRMERRHQRGSPPMPRSAAIATAKARLASVEESAARYTADVTKAADRLEKLRETAPDLVESLELSRSAWKSVANGREFDIEPTRVREKMAVIRDEGLAAALGNVEHWADGCRAEVAAAIAAAEAMPEDAAAEEAWAAYWRRANAESERAISDYADR